MARHRTKSADLMLNRYRGLTREQIRALVEIADLAARATNVKEVSAIKDAHDRVGVPLTRAHVLAYAAQSERAKDLHTTMVWYTTLVHPILAAAAAPEDLAIIRAFCIRHHTMSLLARFGMSLTREEQRTMGRALARTNPNVALPLLAACNDCKTIRRMLDRAVHRGDASLAATIATALGRSLRRSELVRTARHAIAHRWEWAQTFTLIHDHGLQSIAPTFIRAAMREAHLSVDSIVEWAHHLGVRITDAMLQAHLRAHRMTPGAQCHFRDLVATARRYSTTPGRRARTLTTVYAMARAAAIDYHEPIAADEYGCAIGQPLTPDELLSIARFLNLAVRDGVLGAHERRQFCLDRAAERIADAVGAPPCAPAAKTAA